MMRALLATVVLVGVLAGCASTPPVEPPPQFDAVAAVAAIRAAGTSGNAELVVKPLGSNEVEDLREQATQLQAQGRHEEAASALDQALTISPDDPTLLQERAEAALLLHDLDGAERLARQAITIGTEVGPQCRRHWETVVQILSVQAQAATGIAAPSPADAEARRQRDACTVAAPPRY